jgi:hypothetical protein
VPGDSQVFPGLDVGKDGHHAVALNRGGKRLHDAALVNAEAKLRQVFDRMAHHGRILAVVDQPASIGALPGAVARSCGHELAAGSLPPAAPAGTRGCSGRCGSSPAAPRGARECRRAPGGCRRVGSPTG